MTDKGVTIERSPSGLGMGVFSAHLGGGGNKTWEPQQSTIITKLAQTPTTRIHTNETFEIDRRIRKTDEKNNVNRSCGCGGWARAAQLEHDLTELALTHQNLLVGLHLQVDSLKQKNRDLTFQLLMGPSAAQIKPDFPFSPESDEASSPKNEIPNKVEPNNQKRDNKSAKTADTSPVITTSTARVTSTDTAKAPLTVQSPPASLLNGDIVVRRPLPGRSGRGDPRLVRSLDLELLEEEADHTRGLLEEERAKNKYLTSLVEDLKRQAREAASENSLAHLNKKVGAPPVLPPPRPPPRPQPRTADLTPRATVHTSPHARQVGKREASPGSQLVDPLLGNTTSSQVQRSLATDVGRTQADREPRFPPLRQHHQQQQQQERGARPLPHNTTSPANRRLSERSSERDSGTTFPAIASARPEQQQHEQHQQRGRGRYFGRGRTRNRQQQQPQQQSQQQQQQRQEAVEAEPSVHLAKGSGRPPPPREDSRSRRDPVRTPTSPRDSSQGPRGGRHGRDGSVGATSSSQTEIKRGASGQEQEPRPETRIKGRGRAHRRGGRGRPRKEKHNTPSEQPESEQ
ncbi:TOX high mobility group box family member 3 isoform X1 [Procambarus clarkii]|uniref:TOX high mobility group box family member 3 isoform X1 n=1 Tax=Procambarus clarkii TaxID=6728 RepID=UPI001E676E7C|nr:RNA polymerase II degradation factor 1-like isoform X1 [Procambarus clarkii]